MSFPATYNIRYYKGDLYQFVIRPKTSAGEIYPVDETYDSFFRISTQRSPTTAATIAADSSIGDNAITCELRPATGNSLVPGTTYFYDVSIQLKENSAIVYTLLTGTITVTGDINTS
jgi:hypothetical protein